MWNLSGRTIDADPHRILASWCYYQQRKRWLACRAVPLPQRLQILQRFVLPVLLWGAETWHLTTAHLRLVDQLQTAMTRRLMCWRPPAEDPAQRWHIVHRYARQLRADYGLRLWSDVVVERYHRWRGFCMNCSPLVRCAWRHHALQWQATMLALHGRSGRLSCHRVLHEAPMFFFLQVKYQRFPCEFAATCTKESWQSLEHEFLLWFKSQPHLHRLLFI